MTFTCFGYTKQVNDNAARVQHLGTSRTVPRKQYSAKRVALELNNLLENPEYTSKAMEIGKITQAEDGVGIACDAIEQQLKII